MKRDILDETNIESATEDLLDLINRKLKKKGWGAAVSPHEVYGLVDEEREELLHALWENDKKGFNKELLDVACAAIYGLASLRAKN